MNLKQYAKYKSFLSTKRGNILPIIYIIKYPQILGAFLLFKRIRSNRIIIGSICIVRFIIGKIQYVVLNSKIIHTTNMYSKILCIVVVFITEIISDFM